MPDTLFDELNKARSLRGHKRTTIAWQLLAKSDTSDEFNVALDYALENELVPAQVAATMRGETDFRAAPTWTNTIDKSELVWIPPGPFLATERNLGATASGFYLGRHPITHAQFRKFLEKTHYEPRANDPTRDEFNSHWNKRDSATIGEYPATWVSLIDAIHYCNWSQTSLPTEWLWEKAARGCDGQNYPWGSLESSKCCQMAKRRPAKIGSFSKIRSAFGCEDLVGNVSEWCQPFDHNWKEYGQPAMINADWLKLAPRQFINVDEIISSGIQHAPVRGSCFLRTNISRMKASHRRRLSIHRRNNWTGFRVAFFPNVEDSSLSE